MSDKPARSSGILYFFLTAAAVLGLDQLTKYWVKLNIPLGGSIPSSGLFRLTHTQNTGAAFGILQDSTTALALVSAAGAMVILWLAIFMRRHLSFLNSTSSLIVLGLLLGGTLGNFIDRAFIGYVTDFIHIGPWPDFNIADSSVVVGGILLAYKMIRFAEKPDGTTDSPCG